MWKLFRIICTAAAVFGLSFVQHAAVSRLMRFSCSVNSTSPTCYISRAFSSSGAIQQKPFNSLSHTDDKVVITTISELFSFHNGITIRRREISLSHSLSHTQTKSNVCLKWTTKCAFNLIKKKRTPSRSDSWPTSTLANHEPFVSLNIHELIKMQMHSE